MDTAALIIWNSLTNHIKNSESVSTFEQRLKTGFLFRNNYYILVIVDTTTALYIVGQ